jgi:hypothetical protein
MEMETVPIVIGNKKKITFKKPKIVKSMLDKRCYTDGD